MKNKRNKDRTITRLAAIQAAYLYDQDAKQQSIASEEILNYYTTQDPLKEFNLPLDKQVNLLDKTFLHSLYQNMVEHIEEIDHKISRLLTKQEDISGLDSVKKAILRTAITELTYFTTAPKIVINEYVTIAGEFYSPAEVNFINAVLDKITK